MTDLSSEQKAKLYGTLLGSLAQQAQDRLCTTGHHDWSRWHRTVLRPDVQVCVRAVEAAPVNDTFRVKSERRCLNCGVAQVQ